MKYEYKINWADEYYNNLDEVTVRFASDPSIVPYSIPTSLLSERMKKSTCCTLHDRKIWSNSYDFLRITRVYALFLSVSFKPIFVVIAFINNMLVLSAVFYCHRQKYVLLFWKKYTIIFLYRSNCKTILNRSWTVVDVYIYKCSPFKSRNKIDTTSYLPVPTLHVQFFSLKWTMTMVRKAYFEWLVHYIGKI